MGLPKGCAVVASNPWHDDTDPPSTPTAAQVDLADLYVCQKQFRVKEM